MGSKLDKNPQHFLDKNNFVITQESDLSSRGGNSAQHSMMWIIGMYSIALDTHKDQIKEAFIQAKKRVFMYWHLMNKYTTEPTLHWDVRYWPGQPGHMSRDNLQASVCALKLFDLSKTLRLLMTRIFLRLGFLWNYKKIGQTDGPNKIPDWCGPMMWMTALRFRYSPFNILFDLYLGLAVWLAVVRQRHDEKHSGEHLNLIIICETWRQVSSNFVLESILKKYKQTKVPKRSLQLYFVPEYAAPLDQLWIKVLERWPG